MKRNKQAKARCLQVIRDYFGNASWLDTVFKHHDNPNNLTHIDYMFYHFEERFFRNSEYKASKIMRLEPLFCRLAFELGFQQSNPEPLKLQRLSYIIRKLYTLDKCGKINLSNINNIDSITFEQLDKEYGRFIDDERRKEEEYIDNMEYIINEDYEVIGPIDYETAHKYGEFTCTKSKLCYTQNNDTWNTYTCKNLYDVYLILKKGFEKIPEEHNGKTLTGYDDYGLSMVFVVIDEEGEIAYCNSRWNHEGQWKKGFNCDYIMNKKMISELIGRHFNKTFKPTNKWNNLINDRFKRLNEGEDIKNLFTVLNEKDDVFIVELNGKFNFIKNKKCIFDKWFDEIMDLGENIKGVKIKCQTNSKYNIIDSNYNLITPMWVDLLSYSSEGAIPIFINEKGWNYINKKGKLISPNLWFDKLHDFKYGLAPIHIKDKGWNYINHRGELVFGETNFSFAFTFKEKFALISNKRVGSKEYLNYINLKGEILCPDLLIDDASSFKDGFARVKIVGKKWNYINTKGEILYPDIYFDEANSFCGGIAMVYIKNKGFNYINTKGELLSPIWFENKAEFNKCFIENKYGKFDQFEQLQDLMLFSNVTTPMDWI
jgi:hypothetical protein